MDKIFEFINNPANTNIIYIVFIVVGLGLIGNTIKRVMDEIKRK